MFYALVGLCYSVFSWRPVLDERVHIVGPVTDKA